MKSVGWSCCHQYTVNAANFVAVTVVDCLQRYRIRVTYDLVTSGSRTAIGTMRARITEGASRLLNACPSLRSGRHSPGLFSEWSVPTESARQPPRPAIEPWTAWYEWRRVVCVVLWCLPIDRRDGRALTGARPPDTMRAHVGKHFTRASRSLGKQFPGDTPTRFPLHIATIPIKISLRTHINYRIYKCTDDLKLLNTFYNTYGSIYFKNIYPLIQTLI